MNRLIRSLASAFVAVLLLTSATVAQSTINYQGFLYNKNGAPVLNGRVIAGTFKPGFNVSNYSCTYGDFVCNLNDNNYTKAVADGNFIPLNSGVLTSSNGSFSGSGISSATGSKIWLFGFPTSQTSPQPDFTEVLASSSDISFVVPSSGVDTLVNASLATQFVLGNKFSNGLQLNFIPIPEPGTITLVVIGLATLVTRRRRQVSLGDG